jgi:hypothetical protein
LDIFALFGDFLFKGGNYNILEPLGQLGIYSSPYRASGYG